MSNEKKNDGGPAFPSVLNENWKAAHHGMSLRDHFAGLAMQAIVAGSEGAGPQHMPNVGIAAYMFADMMLKAREQ